MSEANKDQIGGAHYGGVPLQHWDIVVMHELNYFEAQITRYVMRCRKKNGIQDLQKAAHFIQKYIEVWEKMNALPAEVVRVVPRSQAEIDYEYSAQEDAGKLFQLDGFVGGNARYQCRACKLVVLANSPLGAVAQHMVCPGVPQPANPFQTGS